MEYKPIGAQKYKLDTLFLDLNGTVALNGVMVDGVAQRIAKLKDLGYKVVLLSGDLNGNATQIAEKLAIDFVKATSTEEKAEVVARYDKKRVAAIGNARIDIGMFENAEFSIVTLQSEGIQAKILNYADVVVNSINDALDLLIDRSIFEATMRI